jgi:hypothetical protein
MVGFRPPDQEEALASWPGPSFLDVGQASGHLFHCPLGSSSQREQCGQLWPLDGHGHHYPLPFIHSFICSAMSTVCKALSCVLNL